MKLKAKSGYTQKLKFQQMTKTFPFKELTVWQKAIDFANEVIDVSENLNTNTNHYRLIEQLESAAASVPQNIAEGKGRFSTKEFIRFLYIAWLIV